MIEWGNEVDVAEYTTIYLADERQPPEWFPSDASPFAGEQVTHWAFVNFPGERST
ncbi:hypothetical protein [Paenibacillus medicaginis]|uniref:Uncharacterized protein n=1 Tax=Paenibacillus medicaginis TaxID=1470560 RepID=A0ABV5C0V6_9BACL